MVKDTRTFEQGYEDGYRSIRPGAPIAFPPHAVPSGKTPYDWGYEVGAQAAKDTNSN
jgi:hypothetical protein